MLQAYNQNLFMSITCALTSGEWPIPSPTMSSGQWRSRYLTPYALSPEAKLPKILRQRR